MSDPEVEVDVYPQDRYGIIQPTGIVAAPDVVALGLALTSLPDWRPGFTEFWDLRFSAAVDLLPQDAGTLVDLERRTKDALAGSSTVILSTRTLLLYSVKFYAHLVRDVVAVSSDKEALDILGIDALPDLRRP